MGSFIKEHFTGEDNHNRMQKRNKKTKIEMPLGITIDSHGKRIDWAMVKIITDNNEVVYSEWSNVNKIGGDKHGKT